MFANLDHKASRRGSGWRRASLGAVGLGALVAVSGLGATAFAAIPAGHTAASGSVVVNTNRTPLTLDPAVSCGDESAQIIGALYSQLTQYGTKAGADGTQQIDPAKIVPYAASKWSVSPNGHSWTFTLRPGLKFPNGDPLNAAAVKFSIDRVYTMNQCGVAYLNSGYKTKNITKVADPSATKVVFTLAHPDPAFPQVLAQMAGSIVDPAIVEAHGGVKANALNTWMQSHAAGDGAYNLSSYQPSLKVVLTANPDYKLSPRAGAAKLTVNIVTSQQTLLLDARSGAANLTLGLLPQSAISLKHKSAVEVVADRTPLQEEINLNWHFAPFNNKLVREALTYALPYTQILKKVAYGYGQVYYGPVDPQIPGYSAANSAPRSFNLAKAKQLIKQAGIKTPVNTTIVVAQGDAVGAQIATIAQAEWQQLGIKLTIQTVSPAEFSTEVFGLKAPVSVRLGGPAVADFGYYTSYDDTCGAGYNVTGTCLPANDALLIKARATANAAKRQALYNEYTRTWEANSPKIPVYAVDSIAVLKRGTSGYVYSWNVDYRRLSK